MRRTLAAVVLFGFPLWGLASISGDVGLRARWMGAGEADLTGFLDLNWRHGDLSLGANLSLPIPELTWALALWAHLRAEPLALSLQGGLGPGGLSYLRQDLRLVPDPWDLPVGELRPELGLTSDLRDPLGDPDLTVAGHGRAKLSLGDLWLEAALSLDIYPFPPGIGAKTVSGGLSLPPFRLTLRNRFLAGWDRSTLELGYRDEGITSSVRATFSPQGFEGARIALRLDADPLYLGLDAGVAPQGPPAIDLSVGYRDEGLALSLRITVGIPLSFQGATAELRLPF